MRFNARVLIKPPYLLLPLSCLVGSATAANFQLGELEGQLDSSLSIGTSIATANPDPKLMQSASGDDGRRNFGSGGALAGASLAVAQRPAIKIPRPIRRPRLRQSIQPIVMGNAGAARPSAARNSSMSSTRSLSV